MGDLTFKTRHACRVAAGALTGTIVGVGHLQGGAPPDEAIVLGWQTGSALWGLLNGLAKDFGGRFFPLGMGGGLGAEAGLNEGPPAVTGPAAVGYVLGAALQTWEGRPSKPGPKK